MPRIHRELVVSYAPEQMYQLVNNVECYPDFLPGCVSSRILERTHDSVSASLSFAKGGMQKSFSTKNTLMPPNKIEMSLLEGPFKHLKGVWEFIAMPSGACRVVLDLEFEFANRILSMMFGPVFHHVAQSMVGSFCQQAEAVYA